MQTSPLALADAPEALRGSWPRRAAPIDRRGIAAAVVGNALEFYDFLTYSFFAVYIGRAFFPSGNALASLLLSLATFGIGFFTRPLGGVLIGAYADRAGRRPALMLTIFLMAIGTLALAVTPSYDRIGLAAPLILVAARLTQGLALGGEVGPSTAFLLESAPAASRAVYVAWQGASQSAAVFAAGLTGLALSTLLTKEQLADWGWRIPFALGMLVVPVGFYIRRRLPETLLAPGSRSGTGVLRLLWREHRRTLLLVILIVSSMTIGSYVLIYLTTYALTTMGLPPIVAMLSPLVLGATGMAIAHWCGRLADRYGRRRVMIVSRAVSMLAIYPCFLLLAHQKSAASLIFVTALLAVLSGPAAVAALTAMSEIFPNAVRSAGVSVAYAVVVSVFGGTTQFVIAWLTGVTGDPLSPAYYWIAACLLSLWAMTRLPETHKLGER